MNIFRIVGTVAQSWLFALRCLGYGRVREPFFVLGGLQLIVLILLGEFHQEWLAGAITPVVRLLGGDAATHYPEHFWRLPEIYRTANAVLMIGLGIFAYGAAISGFVARADRWRPAFTKGAALVPVALLTTGVSWAITSAFNQIPMEIALRSSIIRLGLQAVELGLVVVVLSAFAYAPAFIVLEGASAGRALAESWRLMRRLPLHTLLVIAVPMGVLFPPTFFLFEMNMDEAGLVPDVVGLLLTLLLVIRVFFDVLVIGGLTFLFVHERGGKP
jgi:hypothetical protein